MADLWHVAYNTVGAKVDLKQMWAAAKDPKCWLFASANSGVALGIASVGLFLPTFVKEFGYSTGKSFQALSTYIPMYGRPYGSRSG